jgi:hypothetical protein
VVDRHADQEELTMNSRTALWTGRVLSGIAVLFLVFDGATKLVPIQPVTDSLRELGYPAGDSFARFLVSSHCSAPRSTPGRAPRCWARCC